VDDSLLLRQVLCDAFPHARFEVSTAADGVEALHLARSIQPDLIVADILMPHMDGWALCEELRRDPATRSIPFIFLTTEGDAPKRIKGLEMGADDYVTKPFAKEELVARATRLLARAGGQGRPQAVPSESDLPSLAGHTDHLPMADLLQALSLNGRTGTLHLSGASVGRIYFSEGQILNAETQGLCGEKALFRIMAWPFARFVFQPGPPPPAVERLLTAPAASLLMEGCAHLDELRQLVASLPPPSAVLRVGADQADLLDTLRLDTARRLILYAAGRRGARIEQIVDTVPLKDLDVYLALQDLLQRGLLEEVAPQGRAAPHAVPGAADLP
jgi:DNA-binding response OmpR family regulator